MKDVETILRALKTFDGYEAIWYDSNKDEIVRFQDVVDFVVWQNSEIESLKQDINGYAADQEVWISGYRGTQAENEALKAEIERLKNELDMDESFNDEECRIIASAQVYETDKEVADSLKKICEQIKKNNKPVQRTFGVRAAKK